MPGELEREEASGCRSLDARAWPEASFLPTEALEMEGEHWRGPGIFESRFWGRREGIVPVGPEPVEPMELVEGKELMEVTMDPKRVG